MLYAGLLGSSWRLAAEPIRVAHGTGDGVCGNGHLCIEHGPGAIAAVLNRVLRLPRESATAVTRLVVTPVASGEEWLRTFDDRRLRTRQYETADGVLAERFGILEFRFRLEVVEGGLQFRQLGAAVMVGPVRVPLAAGLAPRIDAREDPAGERRVRIHVRVLLPWSGPLFTYEGIIQIEDPRR